MNFKLLATLGGLIAGVVANTKRSSSKKLVTESKQVETVQAQNCCTLASLGETNDVEYIYAFKNVIVDYRQIYFISRGANDNAFVNFYDGARNPVDTGEKYDEVRRQILGDE